MLICIGKDDSISSVIKKMQIKIILRFLLTPDRMAIIRNTNAGKNVGVGTLTYSWWECKLIQPLSKSECKFYKSAYTRNAISPSDTTFGFIN